MLLRRTRMKQPNQPAAWCFCCRCGLWNHVPLPLVCSGLPQLSGKWTRGCLISRHSSQTVSSGFNSSCQTSVSITVITEHCFPINPGPFGAFLGCSGWRDGTLPEQHRSRWLHSIILIRFAGVSHCTTDHKAICARIIRVARWISDDRFLFCWSHSWGNFRFVAMACLDYPDWKNAQFVFDASDWCDWASRRMSLSRW